MIGIYKIENLINGKVYIGQSNNIERRWKEHKTIAHYLNPSSKQYNYNLYRAFRKYGIENFSFQVIQECNIEQLDELEKYWINYYDSYNNGYNETIGGQGRNIFLPKVYQYDVYGNFLQKYENIHEAANITKIDESNIRDALNIDKNQKLAGGFQWSYEKSNKISDGFCYSPVNCYSKEGKFIKTYLSIHQAAKESGDGFKGIIKSCETKQYSAYNYQWRYWKEFQNTEDIGPNDIFHTKQIKQYDLNGEFIKEYKSMKEASEENNLSYNLISACCHKRQKSAGGYIWCFLNEEPEAYYNKTKDNKPQGKTAVVQLNLNDEFIQIFDSIKEAAAVNNIKTSSHISECCNGKRKTCGGYKWRFLNET